MLKSYQKLFLFLVMTLSLLSSVSFANKYYLDIKETNRIYETQKKNFDEFFDLPCMEKITPTCMAQHILSMLPIEINGENLDTVKTVGWASINWLDRDSLQKLLQIFEKYEALDKESDNPSHISISIEKLKKLANEALQTTPEERINAVLGTKYKERIFKRPEKGECQDLETRPEKYRRYCDLQEAEKKKAENAKAKGDLQPYFRWLKEKVRIGIAAHFEEYRRKEETEELYELFPAMSAYYKHDKNLTDSQQYDCLAQELAHYLLVQGDIKKAKELSYSYQCRSHNPFISAIMTSGYAEDEALFERLYSLFVFEADEDRLKESKSNHNVIGAAIKNGRYDIIEQRINDGLGESDLQINLVASNYRKLLQRVLFDSAAHDFLQSKQSVLWNGYMRTCLKDQIAFTKLENRAQPFKCYSDLLRSTWSELPYFQKAEKGIVPDALKKSIVGLFLTSKTIKESGIGEGAKSQGSQAEDLNGEGDPEIALVWTTLGPTYWHNNLTVFTKKDGQYEPVASKQLIGQAKLAFVKEGYIYVDQVVYAEKEPLCCPTIKKQMKYRWDGEKILQEE